MKKLIFLLLITFFSQSVFSQTGDFYKLYFAGNALLVKAQYDKAIEKYTQAQKLGDLDYVYYNRGNAYMGKKDYANALIDYNKTLKLNDKYAEAYCQRGLVKIALGDKTACEDFKKAAKLGYDIAKDLIKENCK